jgi:hypothetical protein
MSLVLATAPSVEPLLVADAKAMLGIGAEVSDTVMGAFVAAGRQMIDGATGWINRCLITQTWDLYLDGFPYQDYYALEDKGYVPRPGTSYSQRDIRRHLHQGIVLPLAPVQTVSAITYLDSAGTSQTLDPSNYTLVPGEPARIVQSFAGAWPAASLVPGSVKVRFVAGYGSDGTTVPQPFRTAIALQASHLRSLAARNLFISSETVDGIGATTYVVGNGAGNAIDATVKALLEPYRVILP